MNLTITAFHQLLLQSSLRNLAISVVVFMIITGVMGLPGFYVGVSGGPSSFGGPVLRYLALVFGFVLPPAVLIATLFTVSPLARHHEILALKAAGWSMARITAPILLVGAAAVVVSAVLRFLVFPVVEPTLNDLEAQTAHHARIAYPLTNVIAVVIGISLGATRRERTRYAGFGTAWLILVAFYIASATANALGKHGGLPPIVAGWIAPALFLGIAGVLWYRVSS